MSWIRDHFTHFVIPTMRAMIRHRDGKPSPRDVKPLDTIVRPAAACKYQESGLVYATLSSMLPKQDPRREPLLALCRTLDPEKFTGADTKELAVRMTVSGADIVHSIVWNSLRALKKHHRRLGGTMILPGRDVWPWEVISRRQHLKTIYDGRVSRDVARRRDVLRPVVDEWKIPDPEWEKSLVFDTGWNGSIHKHLCAATDKKPASFMLSAETHVREMQLFPGHTGSRAKAIAIEHFPKYFDRATIPDGKTIVQEFESFEEFVKTALLTIWLWHGVSPRKIAALKEYAQAIKEKIKKHKMQVADNPGYQFSDKGTVQGQALQGGYISAPYVNVLSASNSSVIISNTSSAIGYGSATSIPGGLQFAGHLSNQNAATDILSTQPMMDDLVDDMGTGDGWSVYGQKQFYKPAKIGGGTADWVSKNYYTNPGTMKKVPYKKVGLNAESLEKIAGLHGKEAAQDALDMALSEAEMNGASMAIPGPPGPMGPPVPMLLTDQGMPFVDIDGKTKYIVPDKNGMLHKMNQPLAPGMKMVELLDQTKKLIGTKPVKTPIVLDSQGNPLHA